MKEKLHARAIALAARLGKYGSLRSKLLVAFLALTLPALIGISAITTWRQYASGREQTIDQLTSVATLKEHQVTTWFESLAPDLELVVANPRVRSDLKQLVATEHNEFVWNAWRGVLVDTFAVAELSGHKFEEIFFVDTTGTVIVSTNNAHVGASFDTQPLFKQGLITPVTLPPSNFPPYGVVIVAAVPVRDEKNAVQGVLVGVANLNALKSIMQERAGLGESGETYLVSPDHLMLTKPRDPEMGEYPLVRTLAANAALDGKNGSALYENYQNSPVLVVGVFRWIPELKVALLAEQSQTEAFQDAIWGIWTSVAVTLLFALLTVIAAFAVSRSISAPLEDLTRFATRIAGGDLNQTVRIERADEIGTLGNAFNTMAVQLRELIAHLEQRVAGRTLQLQQELIERERAEGALQKARNELSALYRVTATASQTVDLSTILTLALAQTMDALYSNGGGVFLLEEKQDDSASPILRLAAHQGISSYAMTELNSCIIRQGMANWIIDHREPVLIPDASMDDRLPEAIRQFSKMALVLAPMRAERQVWGILALTRSSGVDYRAEEIALLSSIADQIGVAVQSDHLRQRAHQATILEERQRLARELHDSVTQMLYSVMLFAEATRDSARKMDLGQMDAHLNRLRETAQQALREMRLLIYESRLQGVEREGLVSALRRRLEVVENRSGLKTELLAEGQNDLPALTQMELYGIAQEALNNVLKHSGATRVTIHINLGESLQLQIIDNGKGFRNEALGEKAGIGLASMRERAERLGGTLEIAATPGEGTRVEFRAPRAAQRKEMAPTLEQVT